MPKKFEIISEQNNSETSNKKFEVVKTSKKFEIVKNKKFEIQNTPLANNENVYTERWFKQTNLSDCGPMAILNILARIGFENGPTSVQQIRDTVALRRIRENRSTISSRGSDDISERDITKLGWLNAIDVCSYLQDLGITAEPMSNITDIEQLKQTLINNPNKFYISSYGSHFRVFKRLEDSNDFEILDSFNNGPEIITQAGAFQLLDQSVGTTGVLAG